MATSDMEDTASSSLLPRRVVLYCKQCGMPPEYCEYGPDFETHCDPWLRTNHPELWESLRGQRVTNEENNPKAAVKKEARPTAPWTAEQRLTEFYKKYAPDKMEGIPELLEKYAGKEDKLFVALVKKYGEEPKDPYYSDSSDEEDDEDDEGSDEDDPGVDSATKRSRRGAGAKKTTKGALKIVIQKIAQKKKKNLTIVKGMENVEGHKLKDISKAFSKRFAGSSSVKDDASGRKEIILQGDHMYDVAEMIIDKFGVPESAVYLDLDGDIVPFK